MQRAQHVAHGKDADQPVLLEHRQAAELLLQHQQVWGTAWTVHQQAASQQGLLLPEA